MLKKFFAFAASLMLCAAAHAQEISYRPVVAVETFKTVGDTQKFLGEYCSDVITEKLFHSEKFTLLSPDLNDAPKKLFPAYLVKGSVDVQSTAVVKVIIDFELVDATTDALIWGRRVWHTNPTGKAKLLPITIHDTIYQAADKVVNRLTANIESGKLTWN